MNIKKLFAFLLASLMLLSLCACKNGSTDATGKNGDDGDATVETLGETTVTDMIGRELVVNPGSYQRVVCIGAGALRMYCYVGDVNLLCGVEDIDNTTVEGRPAMFDAVARPYVLAYGEVFNTLPSCGVGGPNGQTAEAEKILACDPDIVISEYEDVQKADALQEQLGIPVVTLSCGSKGVFDPVFTQSMELLGTVFNRKEQAEKLVTYVAEQTAEIQSRTAAVKEEDKPSVYICGLGNWGTTDHLMTSETYASFEIANVKNVVTGLSMKGVGPIEEEMFESLGEKMDIAFVDAAAIKNIIPLYQKDPHMFDSCKAWQEQKVYLQMAFNAYYTNFETALANTWYIAKTVYPEQFRDIDMKAKTDEITTAFLGKPLADEIYACTTSYGGYDAMNLADVMKLIGMLG